MTSLVDAHNFLEWARNQYFGDPDVGKKLIELLNTAYDVGYADGYRDGYKSGGYDADYHS